MKISIEKAEAIKKENSSEVAEILKEPIKKLIDKIEEYVNFYNSNYVHHHLPDKGKIKKIILCGGGANSTILTQAIQEHFKISTVTANAWINILPVPENELKDLIYEKSLSFITALGMALRVL